MRDVGFIHSGGPPPSSGIMSICYPTLEFIKLENVLRVEISPDAAQNWIHHSNECENLEIMDCDIAYYASSKTIPTQGAGEIDQNTRDFWHLGISEERRG